MTEQDEIVVDLSRLTLGDFATLDAWSWGKVAFDDALPLMQKAVSNGAVLADQPMARLREITLMIREAIRKLPGN
ncbi:MAG: hypothetical protein WC683_12615 [bacterium]